MATIIQTATGDVRSVDVDPVTLDIIENVLRNARYEMDEVGSWSTPTPPKPARWC